MAWHPTRMVRRTADRAGEPSLSWLAKRRGAIGYLAQFLSDTPPCGLHLHPGGSCGSLPWSVQPNGISTKANVRRLQALVVVYVYPRAAPTSYFWSLFLS
jgi:hypothetical protein